MNMRFFLIGAAMLPTIISSAYSVDLSISADPYAIAGLFTNPAVPTENEVVTITVRATLQGERPRNVPADLTITDYAGAAQQFSLELATDEGHAEGAVGWKAPQNGLYKVEVELDPDKTIIESDETNNSAQITLPVTVRGRKLHFVWYREAPSLRWTTCVTSVNDPKQRKRLAERGVIPLHWEYGGMSWSYYDKEKAEDEPAVVLRQLEELFDGKYAGELPEHSRGPGIDETGGYPGTFKEQASAASMRSLVRAKRKHPERFFAVWHAGGLRKELAQYYRQGADVLLLETYVFQAIPQALGTHDIYQMIRDRLDPLIRSTDMIVPAYGNDCHTLIALDSSMRPDFIDLGEQEQVVRFIRRVCPEMRGIAWYNGGYGRSGVERTPELDRHHEAVLSNADRLFFEYYIKPCVTLMPESLCLSKMKDGQWELTAAISNIGGMHSGAVTVEFLVDGRVVGRKSAPKVPAGANRLNNRVLLKHPVSLNRGPHDFKVRITSALEAAVLDPTVQCQRFVR